MEVLESVIDSPGVGNRERLIQAAREVFVEEGYRASVDRIACRAGVARQTLYNHFPRKEDLFNEVVARAVADIMVSLDADTADLREGLCTFAVTFREKVLSDEGLAWYRNVIAESGRFPPLAEAFFIHGPAQTTHLLSRYLKAAMESGRLRQEDPAFAAEMLLSMLSGVERTRRICGDSPLNITQEKRRIAQIVDCFLRAYAP